MSDGKRSLLAIAASILVIIIWYTFISPPKKSAVPPAASKPAEAVAASEQAKVEETKALPTGDLQANLPERHVTLSNSDLEVEISSFGGEAVSWKTLKYNEGVEKSSKPIELAYLGSLKTPFVNSTFLFPAEPHYEVLSRSSSEAVFSWKSSEVEVLKTVRLPASGYAAEVEVSVINKSGKPQSWQPQLTWDSVEVIKKQTGFLAFLKPGGSGQKNMLFYQNGKASRQKGGTSQIEGDILWAGIEGRYFISSLIPRDGGKKVYAFKESRVEDTRELGVSLTGEALAAAPSEKVTTQYTVYSGPKDRKAMEALNVGLEKSIDYGWFSVIALPIYYLLNIFYKVCGNYGLAIILLTIFIRLLLHPINVKSLKSMKAMQKLQPQIKELQNKYKGNRDKLNMEMMGLFKAHKVNPMSGCLPMALQFPVYIALYRVLWNSIELFHAPFVWFYRDLSAPDPYLVSPILLAALMFVQQLFTPTAGDPAQKKMMMFMPIMFGAFMLFLPAGLVLYILVSTGMALAQQWMYNRGVSWWNLLGFKKSRASA